MIETSQIPFPFIPQVENYSYTESDYFVFNDDINTLPKSKLKTQGNATSTISLTLDPDEFNEFLEYVLSELNCARKYFYMSLDVNGKYESRKCDIISNPKVAFNGARYEISFDIAIV